MRVEFKKCGNCDAFQYHIEGHKDCMECEELSERLINEIVNESELVSEDDE